MNVEEELTKRFADAARAYAEIPVLIGPKWLRPAPPGGKELYQYFGVPKVAKALGRDPMRVARGMLKEMDFSELKLAAEVDKDAIIHISAEADSPEQAPDETKNQSQ